LTSALPVPQQARFLFSKFTKLGVFSPTPIANFNLDVSTIKMGSRQRD
jgi:hypothetical protein